MLEKFNICVIFAMMSVANGVAAERASESPEEIVQQLASDNEQARAEAETELLELGVEGVDALVDALCGSSSPSRDISNAALRILGDWERASWTDAGSAAAVDRFVQSVGNSQNCSGKHSPLSLDASHPFAEKVRVLDIRPDDAAAYLRSKEGVKVHESPGRPTLNEHFYVDVSVTRHWNPEPKDWLYIANLAQEIEGTPYTNGKRHPISISISGLIEDETLVECFKYFRKSKGSPFRLFIGEATISRDLLVVLRFYPEITGFGANAWAENITDEDWAACISAWPKLIDLTLSPTAGRKAIAATRELEDLIILVFRNTDITEADLQPFRNHKKLQVLWVWDGMAYVEYLNQKGTGKWQLEEARRTD